MPIRDYDQYVDKTMEFKVVKINHEFKNVVVSHKALIEADIELQKKEIIKQLEKGQILEGVVSLFVTFTSTSSFVVCKVGSFFSAFFGMIKNLYSKIFY